MKNIKSLTSKKSNYKCAEKINDQEYWYIVCNFASLNLKNLGRWRK